MKAYKFSKQNIHSVMALYLFTQIFWITCFAFVSYALPITDADDAMLYLKKFGYLEHTTGKKQLATMGREAVSAAIKDFQRFAGLRKTGKLDTETIAMMRVPRCGVKDKIRYSTRKKRYALEGSKWRVKEVTYRISKYPFGFRDNRRFMAEIARAFKLWSDVTTLKFKEKLTGQANIDIRFEVGHHGDADPFDGPGSTLAHAFFPQYGGAAHFDDEELWTFNEKFGKNFFQVAAHEIGHSLGLLHSDEEGALMAPFYTEYIPELQLHNDDIQAIQSLYGPPPDTNNAPDLCQDAAIDTITRTQSGSTYVFKGNFYWKVLDNAIAEEYPRKISDDWNGLEGNLDASVTLPTGKTYFFKGTHYWRFTNKKMDSGYPKLISVNIQGIPDRLDAVLVWSGNGKTYFFKGNQYWRFDFGNHPPVSTSYPMAMTEWSHLLAAGIDAAVVWENNRTYLFKGDHYYRYNDKTSEVDDFSPPYPLSTAKRWFGCK